MAAASLDVNFKEELSAIEQCEPQSPLVSTALSVAQPVMKSGFKVLSEAERTAALYSLLQHSTQVQIRFFITVLQQMARSDPMTALLSPAMGGAFFISILLMSFAYLICKYKVPSKIKSKSRWEI